MLLPPNTLFYEKIARTTATVALQNFQWQQATLVLFNTTLFCCVDIFVRNYKKTVIINRGFYHPRFVSGTRQYVLFATDLTDIAHMLAWMKRHEFDNTGRYIIVCQSEWQSKCREADTVNILWNYKILNIVLINYDRKRDRLNGFTYFYPEDCNNPQSSSLKNWESCIKNVHSTCQNMFPLKPKDLHGCPIVVSTFNQAPLMYISDGKPTGADGDLLRIIAETMNFTLQMMTPRVGSGWGKLEANGTWTGSLADVYNGWANFSMTRASITMSRYANFQSSIDYSVVTIGWATHPSELQSSSLKLLRPFQSNVRIALCVSLIIVVAFRMFITSKLMSSLRRKLNVTIPEGIIFHAWALCMGLPVNTLPTHKVLLCLSFFWIWYCFLVRILYQVHLIDSLKTDVYSPELNTLEEAIESKYSFGGSLALRDYYINNSSIYNHWVNVESYEKHPMIVKLSQGFKFVLATSLDTTRMFLTDNPDKTLHILDQRIVTSPTVIFYKKYSPLDGSLSVILTRLRESGIVYYMYLNNTRKKATKVWTEPEIPISMEHYTGCYAILLAGWILSILCFVLEQLMPKKTFKFYKRQR